MGARTITVNPTTPSNTLSFQVPAYFNLDVQAVFANIDASGAGDTTGLLEVADSSGAVIARKAQTQVVTGGTNPGSATWALRLADDGGGAPASSGAYVFVQEVAPTVFGTTFQFSAIPQDGRHLVIFINGGLGTPRLTVNGDAGAHYYYLTETLMDNAGVLSNTQLSFRATGNIPLSSLASDNAQGRAVITIPYYRRVAVGAENSDIDRSIEIESWQKWLNPVSLVDLFRHEKIAGFWKDPAFTAHGAHPITSITIGALSGMAGRASLYKIM